MTSVQAWHQWLSVVEPLFAGLCAAVLAVGTLAVYNWGRTRGLQVQVNSQGGGGVPKVVVAQTPLAAGAGPRPLAAPAWNQLDDVLPDGMQDPFATTDCGEESVAMAIAACGGPPLPAGTLRMLLGGPNRPGLSDARALVYLLGLFGITAHPRQCDADAAWLEWQHSYKAGYLVLALGFWVSPNFLHWVVVRETVEGTCLLNDPWGGLQRTLLKSEAQKLYGGWYVHLDEPVTAPAPAPPGA